MAKFTFIDLFSGIGGFRLGLDKNGGKCLGFSEVNKDAIQTYCDNFNDRQSDNFGDIRLIDELPNHDVLTAGVPCQSWSIAGKNLGFDDDRGQLWNDTIYLLNKVRPKAFVFENVKGLQDPRNREAFDYILNRITEAGYFAKWFLINSHEYGVPQNRQRVYIIGFKEKKYLQKFSLPQSTNELSRLYDYLTDLPKPDFEKTKISSEILFGKSIPGGRTKFQKSDELNDFFLFNDIRNGHSTIHSWELSRTTKKEKEICMVLLRNRRKKMYGPFDGNPLSFEHFKELIPSIKKQDLSKLVKKGILKEVEYSFEINPKTRVIYSGAEKLVIEQKSGNNLFLNDLKNSKDIKRNRINFKVALESLKQKEVLKAKEIRYDFQNSKISSGINGINRIFLPNSEVFSTLVASDTNDFVATVNIEAQTPEEYKTKFLEEVVLNKNYRKITKEEALIIQGFPSNFLLPQNRARWMKLIGNSVSVPVIEKLGEALVASGVFEEKTNRSRPKTAKAKEVSVENFQRT